MALYLEILSGPLTGKKFTAEEGLRVGRREGEILLEEDSKVSGLHAKIEFDNKGRLALMDQGSANAMVLNGRRVKKVALIPGVTFRVGETLMTVAEGSSEDLIQMTDLKPWQEKVQELLMSRSLENQLDPEFGQTFTPVVQLDFVQGVQADTLITCAYGPRSAGAGHLDIDLLDPEAPDRCFDLIPGPGVALFEDHSQGRLLINEETPGPHQPLSEGDQIRIGGTVIRVRYL
ncbi:MAG TPA: FHA domain-containing protein [Pseudobdellovibrionaceae bacterium]|nr:FHA domain-containing protein [Pseudobdellovibrionaceae bacterium]